MADSTLHVRVMQADDARRWDDFVHASPAATFFHLSAWRRVIEEAFGHRCHFLYAERAGQIEGVLPLVHVNSRLFANALISTPFCVYGGIVSDTSEAFDALTAAAMERADSLGVDYLELREREAAHEAWDHKALYYTFRKTIDTDPDANLSVIPRKQRAVVRKARDQGLAIEIDRDVDRFYALYALSLRNLGTPVFAKTYLRKLCAIFAEQTEVLIVTHAGQPVAGVLSFYFRNEVLPYYAGASPAARNLKANDFMYWQLMCRAAERGIEVFDFGRSKRDTGAYEFKRHWGFEPQLLHYAYRLVRAEQMPNLSPANPRYQRFIRAWQKMPVPVTRLVGPMLARNLG